MRLASCVTAVVGLLACAAPASALLYNVSLNSQVHFAFAGPTGMTISWNTYNKLANPTVMYGLTPNVLNMSASSNVSVTYPTSLTYNNHVKITGLTPNTLYYFSPSDLLLDPYTRPPYQFKTSRVAGDMTPYSIAVVVDMGTFGAEGLTTTAAPGVSIQNILKPNEQTTIGNIVSYLKEFEFLVHPGDIAYADTWLKEATTGFINASIADGYKAYESILDGFYNEMTPITTVKPYMIGVGNHEANCDNGGTSGYNVSICLPGQTNFTGVINHFRMPSFESGGLGNFWYSYDYGMVHYVQIDTETDFGVGLVGPSEPAGGTENAGPFGLPNQQINWLTNDLASVDRSKTPWVVVAGHRPWYSSGSICTACQKAFEPIFVKYNVDLYIAGHFHVFERNAPIKNGTADPNELNNPSSPWYIVNGCGGHYDGLDAFTLPLQKYHRAGLETADGVYGWSKITYHNCTHMTHEFIASNNGSVLDSATLYKNRVCGTNISTATNSSTTSATTTTKPSAVFTGAAGRVAEQHSTMGLVGMLFAAWFLI